MHARGWSSIWGHMDSIWLLPQKMRPRVASTRPGQPNFNVGQQKVPNSGASNFGYMKFESGSGGSRGWSHGEKDIFVFSVPPVVSSSLRHRISPAPSKPRPNRGRPYFVGPKEVANEKFPPRLRWMGRGSFVIILLPRNLTGSPHP